MREYFKRIGGTIKQETRSVLFEVRKFKRRPPTQLDMEKAYRAERQVRNEAYVILGSQDEVSMIDQRGRNLVIKSKRKLEIEDKGKLFTGANLLIGVFERKRAGSVLYEWTEDLVFYGNRVDLHLGKSKYGREKNPEKEITTIQPNAKDLTELLKILRGSKPVR